MVGEFVVGVCGDASGEEGYLGFYHGFEHGLEGVGAGCVVSDVVTGWGMGVLALLGLLGGEAVWLDVVRRWLRFEWAVWSVFLVLWWLLRTFCG